MFAFEALSLTPRGGEGNSLDSNLQKRWTGDGSLG